jgi:hypothetical protein
MDLSCLCLQRRGFEQGNWGQGGESILLVTEMKYYKLEWRTSDFLPADDGR